MQDPSPYLALHGKSSTLIISVEVGASPTICYWGPRIDTGSTPENAAKTVRQLRHRHGAQGGPSIEVPVSLSCEPGTGYLGPNGLEACRDSAIWAHVLKVKTVEQQKNTYSIVCTDSENSLKVTYKFEIDLTTDIICIQTIFQNTGKGALQINWASVLCIVLQSELSEIISFSGRWAREFQTTRSPLQQGGFFIENRRGRTSHDRFPGMVLCHKNTTENGGACFGVHLGWSGNHHMRVETLSDGRNIMQAGALFAPGEMSLNSGETYETPKLYTAYTPNGLSALSNSYHDYYREYLTDQHTGKNPRPIHYNSWEAIYFDHTPEKIKKLADIAADLGVERFVLDDGWFKGRRNDKAGLGDWTVDTSIYPDGLHPIINHINDKGMGFGLWVEPEMVNEDSDFYRDHPDWILGAPLEPQIEFRNQYVIDLSRPEAWQNIFNQLDALLTEYPKIEYLKWDMNRDINHPYSHTGHAVLHKQTHSVYKLIDSIRAKHPHIEIESCASGGGRADFGILERTDRIWTSDSNDALDRQWIQRGASYFFPLEVMGSHVGPADCKITHRHLPMSLRAATALFGHMGAEADLTSMTERDKNILKTAFSLHKNYRSLLHAGDIIRMPACSGENNFGVIAKDRKTALFSHTRIDSLKTTMPGLFQFHGLDPSLQYRLKLIWPIEFETPSPLSAETTDLASTGYEVQGDLLIKVGLQLPPLAPQTCVIFSLTALTDL